MTEERGMRLGLRRRRLAAILLEVNTWWVADRPRLLATTNCILSDALRTLQLLNIIILAKERNSLVTL